MYSLIDSLIRNELINNEIGCNQPVLSIDGQSNIIYVPSGTVVTFKLCGDPDADFVIQNVSSVEGIGAGLTGLVDFYPYDVIDKGKLDSNGLYMSSMSLDQSGAFILRAGVLCTIHDINYCTKVSNAVRITVLERECISNWQCRQPLDGYEYDANYCGMEDREASRCKSTCGGTGCFEKKDNTLLITGAAIAIFGGALYLVEEGRKGKRGGRRR